MSNLTALHLAIQANIPLIWWDDPGVGKTYIVHQFARSIGWPMDTWILSTSEPSEIGGLPFADENGYGYRRLISARVQRLIEQTEKAGGGILFFDELNTAAPAVQAVALRVTQADPDGFRWIGDVPLPRELRIVAASNPPECSAGGWDLAAPLANRFYHHQGLPTVDEWCKGIRTDFEAAPLTRLPESWEKQISVYRAYVATFIKTRPALLQQRPKATSELGKAWPSRRSWDMSCTLLAASHEAGQDVQMQLLSGTVGDGAAAEYINWFVHLDLPTPEQALKNPKIIKEPKPEEEHKLYAIISGACAYVREHPTLENWERLWGLLIHIGGYGADLVFAFAVELADEVKPRIEGPAPVPEAGKKILNRIGKRTGVLK